MGVLRAFATAAPLAAGGGVQGGLLDQDAGAREAAPGKHAGGAD